jgi:tetrahydromethanopterin S-methyltransferase subunit B
MKLQTVSRYFERIEQFNTAEADYEQVLHPGIEQTEFPNWLTDWPGAEGVFLLHL